MTKKDCPLCGDVVTPADVAAIRAGMADETATCPACATAYGDVREMMTRPPAARRGPERSLEDEMEMAR